MTEQRTPPEKINLPGIKEKNLGAFIDSFVGNWELRAYFKQLIREKWKAFLPKEVYDEETKRFKIVHEDWSIAYIPRVAKRKAIKDSLPEGKNGIHKLSAWPYFVVLLNSARDNRPQEPIPERVDLLQKNNIDKGIIISEIEGGKDGSNFYFGPNIYPYDFYASLLISEDKKPQKKVTKEDLITWIKFSFLTGLCVFFNSLGAGATREERFHAQVVDPETLNIENKVLEYPIQNENIGQEISIEGGVYELQNYPTQAIIFKGKQAPKRVEDIVEKMETVNNTPYNIIVNGTDVYVIARNRAYERSDCIGKNVGSLECMGEIPVGNIEEPVLGQAGLDKIVHGEDVFVYLKYQTIFDNIDAACVHTRNFL